MKDMISPRLQMKQPYIFNYDNIDSVDVYKYMSESGFINGLSEAWEEYVHEMFGNFEADISANEGAEAVIRCLMPSKRKLNVIKLDKCTYVIECNEGGGRVFLSTDDNDSLILSFGRSDNRSDRGQIDLSCYDCADAAAFIAAAFRSYRTLNHKFWKALSNN